MSSRMAVTSSMTRRVAVLGVAIALASCTPQSRVVVLSDFGDPYRVGTQSLRSRPNQGVDIGGRPGQPVIAPADGTVRARLNDPECGLGLIIDHGDFQGTRMETRYCHLQRVVHGDGAPVRRGETIGLIGLTGDTPASHPHLHFEVRTVWAGEEKAVRPLELIVGCFDPSVPYPVGRAVLTYPVPC